MKGIPHISPPRRTVFCTAQDLGLAEALAHLLAPARVLVDSYLSPGKVYVLDSGESTMWTAARVKELMTHMKGAQ